MGHLRFAGVLAILAFGCEGTRIEPRTTRADEGRTTPTPEPELIEPEPEPMELEEPEPEELEPVEPEPEPATMDDPEELEPVEPEPLDPVEQLDPVELDELEPEELDSVEQLEPEPAPMPETQSAEAVEAAPAEPGLDDGEECTEDDTCDSGYCEELAATFQAGVTRSKVCCAVECSAGAVCSADGSQCRRAGTVDFEFLENGEICTEDAACDSGYCEELAATFVAGISRSRACCAFECSAGAVCSADGSRCISPPVCEYDKSDLFVACL